MPRIFSRRFSREKCPTLTVASYSSRLQSHSDWATFLTIETTETTKAKSGQRKLVQKGPLFIFYYFNVTYMLIKPKWLPLLTFFGTMRHFLKISRFSRKKSFSLFEP